MCSPLAFESKQLPQILLHLWGLAPMLLRKGILQIRVSPLPLPGLHPGLHSRRRQAQTRQMIVKGKTSYNQPLPPPPQQRRTCSPALEEKLEEWCVTQCRDMQALQDKVGQRHVSSNLGQIVKVYLAIADNERGNIPANGEESKNRMHLLVKSHWHFKLHIPQELLQQLPQKLLH